MNKLNGQYYVDNGKRGGGVSKFTDIASDKYNTIHEELYQNAIKRYLESTYHNDGELESFLSTHKIVEVKGKEYDLPSSVIITETKFPFKQHKVDLSEYWNGYAFGTANKDISELISDEDTLADAKVVYINYATGTCKFRSKFTGREFWATIDYINKDTEFDEDALTLKGTFMYMLKNNK